MPGFFAANDSKLNHLSHHRLVFRHQIDFSVAHDEDVRIRTQRGQRRPASCATVDGEGAAAEVLVVSEHRNRRPDEAAGSWQNR